ncbi:hypothetical protein, partial [Bifidobacterium thermophilum]
KRTPTRLQPLGLTGIINTTFSSYRPMLSFPPFHMVDTVIDSVMFRDGNRMAQLSNPPAVAIILSHG